MKGGANMMRMRSNKLRELICGALMVCFAAFCFAGAAQAQTKAAPKVFKWRFQTHWPAASASYAPFKKFIEEEIKALTDGQLLIEVFPAATFVPTNDLFDAWAKNVIQGGTGSTYWISHVPLTAVAGQCPLAFRELWEAEYFHFHMGFEDALKKEHLEKGIMYWTEKIFPTAMVSRKPVKTLSDMKGLKVRSSGKIADMLMMAGASPVLVPGGEIYTALSTGVIEAAHWGAAAGALTMKLCEPAKYYVQPNLAFSATDLVMVSKKAWDELPPDVQKVVHLALRERCWRRSNEYIQEETKALDTMKNKYGVQVSWLDAEAQKALQEAAIKTWGEAAALSPANAEWIEKMKEFLKSLGYVN
jgi:TRAP-type mannitol/chloroaromatic compound transport system substrate-binding protein